MKTHWLKPPLLALGWLLASPSLAAVIVQFDDPGKFTDLSLSGSKARETQEPLLKELEGYFKELGERYLPESDTLEIIVQNIDMAGAFEPWHVPYLTNTRIMRDLYPPRLALHYRWRVGLSRRLHRSKNLKTKPRHASIRRLPSLTSLGSYQSQTATSYIWLRSFS